MARNGNGAMAQWSSFDDSIEHYMVRLGDVCGGWQCKETGGREGGFCPDLYSPLHTNAPGNSYVEKFPSKRPLPITVSLLF